MLKGIVITEETGDILVERYFNKDVSRQDVEYVCKIIRTQRRLPPMISQFGTVYLSHFYKKMYFIAITMPKASTVTAASILLEFERMLERSLKNELSVDTMKVDYSVAYILMDQFLDEGYPFIDEFNLICTSFNDTTKDTIGYDVHSPWRTPSPLKVSQYIEINVEEEIHSRINSEGKSEYLFVAGNVNMFSRLTDPPNINLSYSLPSKLENFSFHRCVDPCLHLSRKMQFIPPDGQFTLMSYTCKTNFVNLPIFLIPKFTYSNVSVIFDITLRIGQEYENKIKSIQIYFTLPHGYHSPSCATGSGSVNYLQNKNQVVWLVDPTNDKELLTMSGSCSIDKGINKNSFEIPIFVNFKLEEHTVSGFEIEAIEPINRNKCTKVIKYQTKAGKYIFDSQ